MTRAIEPGERVCVTGAGGYIGSHVVEQLLQRGYRVRGTVRDPGDEAKNGHLRVLAERTGGELELVAADLLRPGAFDEAVVGCPYVCHVASVVRLKASDPQREIVDPAIEGTRSVLGSIDRAGVARRVVITSSIAAVIDDTKHPTYTFDESDWNESATLEASPYPLGKAMAERAAYDHVAQLPQQRRYDLVTINPTMVLGPVMSAGHAQTSPQLIHELIAGKFPLYPDMYFSLVDVRDVAAAHVLALENPTAAGRHILSHRGVRLGEICRVLREGDAGDKVPRFKMPGPIMLAVALFHPKLTLEFVRRRLGPMRRLDNRKSREQLGIEYRPLRDTLLDTARTLQDLA